MRIAWVCSLGSVSSRRLPGLTRPFGLVAEGSHAGEWAAPLLGRDVGKSLNSAASPRHAALVKHAPAHSVRSISTRGRRRRPTRRRPGNQPGIGHANSKVVSSDTTRGLIGLMMGQNRQASGLGAANARTEGYDRIGGLPRTIQVRKVHHVACYE